MKQICFVLRRGRSFMMSVNKFENSDLPPPYPQPSNIGLTPSAWASLITLDTPLHDTSGFHSKTLTITLVLAFSFLMCSVFRIFVSIIKLTGR